MRILSQAAPDVGRFINSVDDIHMPLPVEDDDNGDGEEVVAVG
jgi:hypothetical protein